ncbi:MAG: nitroreductase family protein [Pseudomonadota bacterium]
MTLFTIDRELCRRDGLCVQACPARLIAMKSEEDFPAPVDQAEEICINCGHCVAACPHGALALVNMNPRDLEPVSKDLRLTLEQAAHFLKTRRSIRAYKTDLVPRETLEGLIELARYAPTGHNSQSVEWLVIQDPAEVKRLASLVVEFMTGLIAQGFPLAREMRMDRVVEAWEQGFDRICRGAPHLIFAHGHKDDRFAATASTIALTYLELAAFAMGLGACWAGYVQSATAFYPPLAQALNLPENHVSLGAMMIGRPREKYYRIPARKSPRVIWR